MNRIFPVLAAFLISSAAPAATPANGPAAANTAAAAASPEGERAAAAVLAALGSVVHVKVSAIADARSLRTLGREREGSGVVLAPSGLVLTIGYLIVEAESIMLTSANGKTVSGTVAAYDHASGFGLVRPTVPLGIDGVALGNSRDVAENEKLIFANQVADGQHQS